MNPIDRLLASVDRVRVPVLGSLRRAGPRDRVFDALMLCGPCLIVFIAVVGRTVLTVALAALYVVSFVAYVLYEGTRDETERFRQ